MSWEDQGRQYHMWFGHGTAADKAKQSAPGSSVVGKGTADRVLALAYGAMASLPPAQRRQVEAQYHNGTLPRLKEAMTAWLRATALNQAAFGSRLFGRSADDPVVRDLHMAALRAATAASQDELRDASERLARAMQSVGIEQWPRFVADAAERARDPATQAAIEKSRQPPGPGRDAIRPVYPLETLLPGLGAKRAIGVARATGEALLRQFLPESRSPTGNARRPESMASGVSKQTETPGLSLPAKPDDLLTQGWKEITHPEAAKLGHRKFENPKTGEIVRFDKGRPGQPGFEGQDHYHRLNPNKTGKRDEYLDLNGDPVARGSGPSHILPRAP